MNHSAVNIVALCDEILLAIFNKLDNMDVLYSLIGVNQKFDRLARDITFTQSLNLVTISSNVHNDSRNNLILNRFCLEILPRIQHNIECLILDQLSVDRVFCIGNYPKLHKLSLVKLPPEMVSRIFYGKSSFIDTFKHQISHLTVTINEDDTRTATYMRQLSTNVFTTIFVMFTNLIYLHYGFSDDFQSSPRSLINFLSIRSYTSNISHLNIRVYNFNDCLCLLDGRLRQLHTFIVEVDEIQYTTMTISNTKTISNLKCFSLVSFDRTTEYDSQIVPLLRKMSQLEKLTLSLIVHRRISFIDGSHLVNDILSELSYLHTFIFSIITQGVIMDEELLPKPDDIRRALIQKGYNVECYTDYCRLDKGQCHIYSLPFSMEHMYTCTNKFPGGLFMSVRHFVACDLWRPFEPDFFLRISQAFPLLNKLTIWNSTGQKKKLTYQQDEHERTFPIIEYSHLTILNVAASSLDYVEQFLFDFNTRLPCLNTLHINYELLLFATQYFTINAARANCSKVQRIILEPPPMIYPENFYLYFPCLQMRIDLCPM